jgi:protein SCO1/2
MPAELRGVKIEPRIGARIPGNVRLRDSGGNVLRAHQLFDGERPVLWVFAYYQCPMLCSLVLDGVVDGLRKLEWAAGSQYQFVVVSFDPRDTPANALAFETRYRQRYGRAIASPPASARSPGGSSGWRFLVGDAAGVRQLADSMGFHYRWDEQAKQFAHAAGAFIVTPDGALCRALFGVSFPPGDLKLALTEAVQGRLGGVVGRVLLFCFHYDPSARGYVIATQRIMRAFGVLTMIVLGLALWKFWRTERRRTTARATLEAVS